MKTFVNPNTEILQRAYELSIATTMSMDDACYHLSKLAQMNPGKPYVISCDYCRTEYDKKQDCNCRNCGAPLNTNS